MPPHTLLRDDRPRHARATMRDVAALAGVGVKTVSRVVNGQPNVSDEIIARVTSAIRELNYEPDLHAGNLRRHSRPPQTLGVIIENVANDYWAEILRAIEDVAVAANVVMFASSHDADVGRELNLVASHLRQRVDALLIATVSPDQAHLVQEQRYGTPLVFIDREPVGISADTVASDSAAMAALATQHLLDHGHARIAYIGDRPELPTSAARSASFVRTLREAGFAPDPSHLRQGARGRAAGYEIATELMSADDPPTAILSAKNQVTEGVLRALHQLGLHRSVALVGIDDIPMLDLLEPAVTVVAQDTRGIGQLAAQRAFARIAGDASEPRTFHVPATLVARGSGEIPPSG